MVYLYVDPASRDLDNPRLPEYHLAAVAGDVRGKDNLLVRIQSRCFLGEVFGDLTCDCAEQKVMAMQQIQREGFGVLVYLMQEGKGVGLLNKVRAAALAQSGGLDMYDAFIRLGFPPDMRSYAPAAEILEDLGVVPPVRLLTNNPDKITQLAAHGIEATVVPLQVPVTAANLASLLYRRDKLGHWLKLGPLA